jgi:hypothetical protein
MKVSTSYRIEKGVLLLLLTAVLWSLGGLWVKFINWNPVAIAGAIFHGGLNTALESLAHSVPITWKPGWLASRRRLRKVSLKQPAYRTIRLQWQS